jgi:CBS domain-containing protein
MTRAPDTMGELMTTDVVTVAPDATVRDALRAMIEHDIGSVVVAEGGASIGVFTERDVTRHVLTDAAVLEERVHELMSTPPIAVAPSEQVIDAFG